MKLLNYLEINLNVCINIQLLRDSHLPQPIIVMITSIRMDNWMFPCKIIVQLNEYELTNPMIVNADVIKLRRFLISLGKSVKPNEKVGCITKITWLLNQWMKCDRMIHRTILLNFSTVIRSNHLYMSNKLYTNYLPKPLLIN